MENIDYARVFEEVADLLELQGANPFRIRAYRNAARTIETLSTSIDSLLADPDARLDDLPGIGKDLAGKIAELHDTGELEMLLELRQEVPPSLIRIMRIPGLGPKRAKQLWEELDVTSVEELDVAARDGRLLELAGFGETLQANILKGIERLKGRLDRFKLSEADTYAEPLLEHLKTVKGLVDLEIAGSYRRRFETVGDLDILATAADSEPLMARFTSFKAADSVLAKGPTKSSIRLRSGLQVDLRVVPRESYGAALYYFTGSKAHNIATRGIARERGLKINEYGVFEGERLVGGATEEEVFDSIDLPWIPPELREDRGEIQAAREGCLPQLVGKKDIRGDFQMHSTYSDGKHTIEELVEACRQRGYGYMAITDHTPALAMNGVQPSEFRDQYREIDALQQKHDDIRILKSAEVDILEDGTLDLPDELLDSMDVVVIAVHTHFNLGRAEMTRRICQGLRHPRAHILAHPTGRIINKREPYPVDIEEIVKVAREEGVALELNAQPDRLDLRDYHVQMARDAGVKIAINTDAHRLHELDFMRYGVDQARRGWLEKKDVLNTHTWPQIRKLLRR